jgi:16S rRNA G966 N2-methylase RsmD
MVSDALMAVRRLERNAEPFDLVWADPPYEYAHYETLLGEIDSRLPLAEDALVAIEHRAGRDAFPAPPLTRLAFHKTTRYGNVAITYFRRES